MWQVTRKAAELIKLVIVTMNTVLIYHATPTHAQGKNAIQQNRTKKPKRNRHLHHHLL